MAYYNAIWYPTAPGAGLPPGPTFENATPPFYYDDLTNVLYMNGVGISIGTPSGNNFVPTYVSPSTSGQFPKWNATNGQLVNSGLTPAPFVGGATAGWTPITQTGPVVFKVIQSSVFAGGGTSFVPAVTGITSSWFCWAQISASTNSVSITKTVTGTNQVTITFSADPGAGTSVQLLLASAAG